MAGTNAYEQFINDDDAYLLWLADNPSGYVVNSHRIPVAEYLILHRASCRWINTGAKNNWTTTDYIKTCSESVPPLETWVRQAASGRLKPCGACKPTGPLESGGLSLSTLKVQVPSPPKPVPMNSLQTSPLPADRGTVPTTISTGCLELDRAWATYASMILHRSQILIPDTDHDLSWHAFLGHSIDMQGFRAAEFAGVDPLTRNAPRFLPLKARGIGVPELAALWEIPLIRQHLMARNDDLPLDATLGCLRSYGGAVGSSLADAFQHFPWRKFHWSVRALLQNSSALKSSDYSFRDWLRHECDRLGVSQFPPADFRQSVMLEGVKSSLERALRSRLQQTFYMVGPAMSAYMLCDWQLWLWQQGLTAVFANFKLDSFHEAFVKKFGRGIIPADEAEFARWWIGLFPDLPPRLANECIWLAVENKLVVPW